MGKEAPIGLATPLFGFFLSKNDNVDEKIEISLMIDDYMINKQGKKTNAYDREGHTDHQSHNP